MVRTEYVADIRGLNGDDLIDLGAVDIDWRQSERTVSRGGDALEPRPQRCIDLSCEYSKFQSSRRIVLTDRTVGITDVIRAEDNVDACLG